MASTGIPFLIFTATYIIAGNADVFVKVQCKPVNVGQYGQQSLLECVIQTSKDATDTNIDVVTWKKGDKEHRLVFNKGNMDLQPGYSFAEQSGNELNMNVSLLITHTTLLDEGDYTCEVLTDRGYSTATTSLKVTAKYSTPTISMPDAITQNTEGTLKCDTFGGYPEGQLRWFDVDRNDWTKSATMVSKKTENGLFHLSSSLHLLQGSIFSKYTCVVFNASGGKEDEATIDIPDAGSSHGPEPEKFVGATSKIVAPVVVIGSLIVGLLLVLVVRKMRTRRDPQGFQTCNTAPEQGEEQQI